MGNFVNLKRIFYFGYTIMRFTGNIEAKSDNKGRVFIPACFRRILQAEGCEKLILRKEPHQQCLVLYPECTWNSMVDELRKKLNRWNSYEQMSFRQFVANVDELTIDANGRILLQKKHRNLADIDQDVCFIGVDDTIEIWSRNRLDNSFMEPDDFGRELERIMTSKEGDKNE